LIWRAKRYATFAISLPKVVGLQMAHLWRQLGGSSWNMIFSKRKLLQDIQALARLQYQVI
ncbi:hypothetical protein BXA18_19820, partial [Acinetobacter baumannii]